MRIDAHQFAVMIGIAVAGAGGAGPDVAHHRTGIAADLVGVGVGSRCFSQHGRTHGLRIVEAESASRCGGASWAPGALAKLRRRPFVRMQMILRADRQAVNRRRCRIRTQLPTATVHQNINPAPSRKRRSGSLALDSRLHGNERIMLTLALARLYANGIIGAMSLIFGP